MTKASDNAFPSILITEGTEPSAPAAGKQRLYIDSTTHHLTRTNSSGTETDIESAAANGLATDTLWDAAGDLVQGTGANTAAKLASGTISKVLTAAGVGTAVAWSYPPGYEFDYVERTSNLSPTATTETTAEVIVTGGTVTYDGSTTIYVQFYAETVRPTGTAAHSISLYLFANGTSIGRIGLLNNSANNTFGAPVNVWRKLTPASGTMSYSIRTAVSGGTGLVSAGAGGTGTTMPAFIRVFQK